jgi:hypothetical protein
MPGLYTHTTRASGLTLTANIYNTDHQNHIDNQVPLQMDDYSLNVTQMKVATDPGDVGTESLATSLAGELERIRFVLDAIIGDAQWYSDPAATILSLNNSVNNLDGPDREQLHVGLRIFA